MSTTNPTETNLFAAVAQAALYRLLDRGARATIGHDLALTLAPRALSGGWGELMGKPVYVHEIGWDRETQTGIYQAHSLGGLR
jgi:hypothetical protein